MRIDVAAQTDVGRRKSNNEDFYGVFREDTPDLALVAEGALLCVADGLGGHVGGEIASKLAVSVFKDILKQAPPEAEENGELDEKVLEMMRAWVGKANESIHRTNIELVKKGRPMGTTLLAVLVEPKKVHIVNVGDSRCYHLRDGEFIDKTEDHSWVDEQVKQGLMSRSEAESDARRNLVTRSIGTHPEVDCDSYRWNIVPGDMLLLCTDGLVNMVKDKEIQAVFQERGTPADIAHRLVDLANENGGKDNITVIVAYLSPSLVQLARWRISRFFRKRGRMLLWLLSCLLFGAAGVAIGYYLGITYGLK